MKFIDVPLKRVTGTIHFGVRISQELKQTLSTLSKVHGVNVPEWARAVLHREALVLISEFKKRGGTHE